MSDVEELVAEARRVVASILEVGTLRLLADADVRDVQPIVAKAEQHLEDVETYALLAAGGHRQAETAIKQEIVRLRELQKALADDQDR